MLNKKLIVGIKLISLCALMLTPFAAAQDEKTVSFENDIKPILENHCINCHGPEKEEGTRLDIRDDAMAYIEVGDAENSPFYEQLISDDEEELMPPPDEENPLSAEQISLVKTWINEGADWPENIEIVDAQNVEADDTDTQEESTDTTTLVDNTVWNAIGSFHPAVIHLPIGLLLAAALFALFSMRGNFVMSDCAYYCLWLGTIGAVVGCVTGWWFCELENRETVTGFQDLLNQDQKIFWHRTSALVCTAFAVLLCLFAAGARARDPDDGLMWKLGLMVLAAGIAFTGHEGGELTHGKDLYKDFNKLIETIIPLDAIGLGGAVESEAPGEEEKGADAPEEGTGTTSEEKEETAPIE